MTFVDDICMQESAIFIADSHYKQKDTELLKYFEEIPKGRQIFLMGDIFHVLIGSIDTSCIHNMPLIKSIATLTYTNNIIFIEGNHDFGIRTIWDRYNIDYKKQNLHIFSYAEQPIIMRGGEESLYILAHGDLWIGKGYHIYRKLINNQFVLSIFRYIDKLSCGIIYKKVAKYINKKRIAEFSFFRKDYEAFMRERIRKYRDFVIKPIMKDIFILNCKSFCIVEGHYHMGMGIYEDNIAYNALKSCYFHKQYLTFKKHELLIEVEDGQ